MRGPIDPAIPVVVAQMAMAFARSPGGKTLTRIDSVDGMINAAPTPITARQAMIWLTSVARDARRLAKKKVARPSCNAPLRPKRSPSAPVVKSKPAKTSEYAATTHWSCDSVAPSSRDSVGSATFNVEFPPKTMSRLRQRTARVHHRRAYACSGVRRSVGESSSAISGILWQLLPDIANWQVAAVAKRHAVSQWSHVRQSRPAGTEEGPHAGGAQGHRAGAVHAARLRGHHGRGDRRGLRGVAAHLLPVLPDQGGRALRRLRRPARHPARGALRPTGHGAAVPCIARGDAGAGVRVPPRPRGARRALQGGRGVAAAPGVQGRAPARLGGRDRRRAGAASAG